MTRRDHEGLIENSLKRFVGNDFRYEKNSEEMYALLKEHGSLDNAIRNAKRLSENYEDRQDYANHNSRTTVWELVEELLELKE